jgi:hypothetical protein
MSRLIREEIETHASPKNAICSIECETSWEILQYCQEELLGNHYLNKVATLTGTTIQAQTASCEEYVQIFWGASGLKVLDALVSGLSKKKQTGSK